MPHEKSVIERAIARRDELRVKLAEVESFIRLFELLSMPADSVVAPAPRDTPVRGRVRAPSAGVVSGIADMAAKAIQVEGRPLQRSELVEWIEKNGTPINSQDKARYIGTILWRQKDRFENIEGRGYWLKSLAPPPVDEEAEVFDLAAALGTKAG